MAVGEAESRTGERSYHSKELTVGLLAREQHSGSGCKQLHPAHEPMPAGFLQRLAAAVCV
jgi:hypothetical protein